MISRRAVLLTALLLPAGAIAEQSLTIAVASNFHPLAEEIAERFEAETGIDIKLSPGSTGKLYAQIVHGAPYDVFLAADVERPRLLIDEGIAARESLAVYAVGSLVLWSARDALVSGDCNEVLRRNEFRYLAIANPDTAPYGAAARHYLREQDLWDAVSDKLVLGENIAQTYQFVATGNATLGLVAAAQVWNASPDAPGCMEPLPESDQAVSVLRQAMVVLNRSGSPGDAAQFTKFMQSKKIRGLIRSRGYTVAGES